MKHRRIGLWPVRIYLPVAYFRRFRDFLAAAALAPPFFAAGLLLDRLPPKAASQPSEYF